MPGFSSILDSALRSWIKHDPAPRTESEARRSKLKIVEASPRDAEHAANLAKMVEAEIIPRLMLSHQAEGSARTAAVRELIAPERYGLAGLVRDGVDGESSLDVGVTETFARMVLSKDSESLIAFVGSLLQAGVPMEAVYVDLLVPAARRLGEYWEDDVISFADVTIGLGRMQQVVRMLKWGPSDAAGPDHSAPSALFAPAACEQHTFGLFIIEESFRRAGWRTWIETSGLEDDTIDMVRHHWFDLIGLSASSDVREDQIRVTIAAVRKVSRNRGLFIMVGGRLFTERPELVAAVGADATAPNGREALLVADKAVRRLAANG